jgi:hypothetical protein
VTTQVQLTNTGGQTTFEGFITPGPLYVRALPFTFATNGLTTGVPFVQLRAGDVIYDIGFAIPVAFDGTTPRADVGTFESGGTGIFNDLTQAVDLTNVDTPLTDNDSLSQSDGSLAWLSGSIVSLASQGSTALETAWPLTVTADCILLLVVSQDGTQGGGAVGSTVGTATAYVLTSSPG